MAGIILVRSHDVSDDLVTHELCHVWQMQHRPIRMPLSYLGTGYAANQYERQARAAAARPAQRWTSTARLPDGSTTAKPPVLAAWPPPRPR